MAQKNNIRSIRFSDEFAELIDRQNGDTFTEKLENLVTICSWELPEKERQIKELDEQIQQKKQQLMECRRKYQNQQRKLQDISGKIFMLESAVKDAIEEL